MNLRRLTNCWLVAMWIWGMSWFKSYAFIRRSLSLKGLVPHFGNAHHAGWKYLRVVEYVPPKRDLWTRRNVLLLFEGHYRVWHLRVKRVRRWETREAAMADYLTKEEMRK